MFFGKTGMLKYGALKAKVQVHGCMTDEDRKELHQLLGGDVFDVGLTEAVWLGKVKLPFDCALIDAAKAKKLLEQREFRSM